MLAMTPPSSDREENTHSEQGCSIEIQLADLGEVAAFEMDRTQ